MTRKRWRGYTDLGAVRVPPLPAVLILTDRADGTLYKLVHNGDRIGLDDDVAVNLSDGVVFSASQGPTFSSDPTVRLIVRGGALGYEVISLPIGITDIGNLRLLTRRGFDAITYEIVIPAGTLLGTDALAYQEVIF